MATNLISNLELSLTQFYFSVRYSYVWSFIFFHLVLNYRNGITFVKWLDWLLAASNGLKMKSRLLEWGLLHNDDFKLCGCADETQDHVFFLLQFLLGGIETGVA